MQRDSFVFGVYFCILVVIASRINETVPHEYMDEVFHVNQTKQYCRGDFLTWDPKITTPPGLYIASWILVKIYSLVAGKTVIDACSIEILRATNIIFNGMILYTASKLIRARKPTLSRQEVLMEALGLATFPVLFMFSFLHYTDSGSVALVLSTFYLQSKERTILACAVGLLSITFRQTNIIWVALSGLIAIDHCIQAELTKRSPVDGFGTNMPNISIKTYFDAVLSCKWSLTRIAISYLSVAMAFLSFIIWNGGIVLGDRSMHTAVFHGPQILYFAGIHCLLSPGTTLSWMLPAARFYVAKKWRLLMVPVFLLLAYYFVHHQTLAHPYLLADNRHYTFYVWKDIINRTENMRYLLIPGYSISMLLIYYGLSQHNSAIVAICTSLAIAGCLIPAWLLEFRYFLLPTFLLRILTHTSSVGRNVDTALGICLSAIVLYIFSERGFVAANQTVSRFMW